MFSVRADTAVVEDLGFRQKIFHPVRRRESYAPHFEYLSRTSRSRYASGYHLTEESE
jgi:hypothetical protein